MRRHAIDKNSPDRNALFLQLVEEYIILRRGAHHLQIKDGNPLLGILLEQLFPMRLVKICISMETPQFRLFLLHKPVLTPLGPLSHGLTDVRA